MALFDEIYNHSNTMQSIEDTDVVESIERTKDKESIDLYDEKRIEREELISHLTSIIEHVKNIQTDPDEIYLKVKIGETFKMKYKGKGVGWFR